MVLKYLGLTITLLLSLAPRAGANPVAEPKAADFSVLEQLEEYNPVNLSLQEQTPLERVNSVFDLTDVFPRDWAYSALERLADRYGCLLAYPDGTYRGNRVILRYEFAAQLAPCLDALERQIKEATGQITETDLQDIRRLQQEFAAELATIRGQIDNVEAQTAELEANRFTRSVTVFGGEVVVGLSAAAGGGPPGDGDSQPAFHQFTRLQTVSTFTGKDRLRVELAAGNFDERGFGNREAVDTDMALLSFQADSGNRVELSKVEYRFAVGDRVVFTFRPVGFSLSSVLTANSPYFDSGRGALSRFAEENPVFKIGRLDAGMGLDWLVADKVRFQLAYGTRNSENSNPGSGLFGNDHSALGAQLLLRPAPRILTGVSYINGYDDEGRLDTFTGSFNADTSGSLGKPAHIHAVSGTLQWRLQDHLTFGTWGGLMWTDFINRDASATTTTYLFSLGYSDPFGRRGDLAAILFGQPPKLVSGDGVTEDADTSLHFEAFYRFRMSDRLSITPGFFYITNPEHNSSNDDIFVGTVRSVFRF